MSTFLCYEKIRKNLFLILAFGIEGLSNSFQASTAEHPIATGREGERASVSRPSQKPGPSGSQAGTRASLESSVPESDVHADVGVTGSRNMQMQEINWTVLDELSQIDIKINRTMLLWN